MRKYSIGVFFDVLTDNQKDWEDNLAFVNSLDEVEHIEILLEYVPTKQKEIDFFLRLAKKYTVIIHAPFMDLTLLSVHTDIVDASIKILKKAYIFSQSMGAQAFTVHAGLMPSFWKKEVVFNTLKKNISKIQEDDDLPICIENMPERKSLQMPFPSTFEDYATVGSFAGLTLDNGHFMKSNVDFIPVLEKLTEKIHDIHLHDCKKTTDHLALGTGDLNIQKVLETLEKVDYDKFLTLEVVGREEIRRSWKILKEKLITH